jgi:ribosomal-protein-alanine N-acetyltransferase
MCSTFPRFLYLTTDRLVLRELLPSDATDVFVFRSDPEVQKYNAVPMKHVSEAQSFIEEMRAKCAAQQALLWAVCFRDRKTVLGLVGFGYWNRFHHRAEVGYDLARAYWGRGIGSGAVQAIIRFGFERMRLHCIEAATIADNVESVHLLGKLGIKREAVRREYSLEEDGAYHDSAMYGLVETRICTVILSF